MALLSICALTAGCGGSDDDAPAAEAGALVLEAGSPPSERDCGFEDAASVEPAAPGSERVEAPEPGVYRYATTGTETVPGEAGARRLPRESEALVTPSRTLKGVTCFGSQRTFSDRTRIPEVYVLRGEDVYITALGFDTPNLVESFNPRPAVLAVSGTETVWSGSFKGSTSGDYRVEIIGRRNLRIGGKSVRAVGLRSDANYQGEAEGSRRTTTWLAADRSMVLQEEGESVLVVGGGEQRLRYRTKLVSLTPEAG